ncbi:uncharacterized protein LOC129129600 isoform X3 [Agelaius phoeniceus]|uniref:uncharacterized protein LOC129129600 isoform X3 n=1 Tax=Agelaius phoeniceus TaxID=39638 RepID=UPI004054FB6C
MINSSCSFSVSCSSDNKELNSNPAFILPGYSHQESRSNGCLNGYLCPSPGFPYTRRCRLTNSSPVPLTFQLRMSDDGTQPAVDSVDQIRRDTDPAWRKGIHFYVEPREFTMNPSQGTILPQGHQDIEVTLCSNTVMEFYQRMLVDLEGIGKGVATLIITARRELKQLAQKLEEEAKALEEEERRKEEKNGVSVGKQPPKLPEKGKTPREEGNQNPKKGNQGPREEGNQSIREEGKQTPREEAKQTPRKEKQTSRKEGNQIPREEGNQNPREGNQSARKEGNQSPKEEGNQSSREEGN